MERPTDVPQAYTLEHTARLTGVSEGQLRSWARGDFYVPQYKRAGLYSFVDLVALRVLHELRNVRRMPLPELRRFGGWLRKNINVDNPWASLRVRTDGREIIVRDPSGRTCWVSNKPMGQLSGAEELELPFEDVVMQVRERAHEARKRTVGKTERRRGVLGSSTVVAGTRIPVRAIKEYSAAGHSVDQILEEYPGLTAADVEAALRSKEETAA